MVLTVNYLGDPDNGAILTGYLGSWLLVGAYLSVGSCMSALAKNQVIAFILTVSLCFLFVVSGFSLVLDVFNGWAPQWLLDVVASFSFLTRSEEHTSELQSRPHLVCRLLLEKKKKNKKHKKY